MFGEERKHEQLETIIRELRVIIQMLRRPTFAKLYILHRGHIMPKSIQPGQTATAVFSEFDQFNQPITGPGPISFASDNTAVATVDASGVVTAVAAGTANISGTDAGDGLTASDVLTVEAPVPVPTSATLTLQ